MRDVSWGSALWGYKYNGFAGEMQGKTVFINESQRKEWMMGGGMMMMDDG